MSKIQLFLELAQPDINGFSRWVSVKEFDGKYACLKFGNGADWCRRSSNLRKKYVVVFDRSVTSGNSIDAIKLDGFNKEFHFSQSIRPDIVKRLREKPCVFTGVKGFSENTTIEIDHKNGQKNEENVSNMETQQDEDFQPTTKCMNDIKRNICKNCIKTGIRPSGCNIKGNVLDYYEGNESLEKSGCIGCYWYDPVKYRETQIDKARRGEI